MKKSLLTIAPLTFLLLAAALAPAVAGEPAPAVAPAVQPAPDAMSAGCAQPAVAPAAGNQSLAPSLAGLSAPAPLFVVAPCPQVRCFTSFCTQSSECTAAPSGKCNLFCTHPKSGCCLYP